VDAPSDKFSLASLSLSEFLAKVASTAEPVPAGGSVAALAGAASAALLVLACGVLQRHHAEGMSGLHERAARLQHRLLELIDEDAQAFQAFLKMKRSGTDTGAIVARTSHTPLLVGGACAEVVELSRRIEATPQLGALVGDVRAARHLAQAALASALDIAEQDIGLHTDVSEQQAMRDEIAELRRR
jgi:formiminotetrahydrofolate cyclodeaminase